MEFQYTCKFSRKLWVWSLQSFSNTPESLKIWNISNSLERLSTFEILEVQKVLTVIRMRNIKVHRVLRREKFSLDGTLFWEQKLQKFSFTVDNRITN